MLKLMNENIIKIPPINSIDPLKNPSRFFYLKDFIQYHCQIDFDTEKCYFMKNARQNLFDSNIRSFNFDVT